MQKINRRKARRGFTLIELMIVIAIIGVLAAIAVPNFRAARKRANVRACYANQKTIVGAVEMYNLDNNTSETDLEAIKDKLVEQGYLQAFPDDPGGLGTYSLTDANGGITCSEHGAIQGDDGAAAGGADGAGG